MCFSGSSENMTDGYGLYNEQKECVDPTNILEIIMKDWVLPSESSTENKRLNHWISVLFFKWKVDMLYNSKISFKN